MKNRPNIILITIDSLRADHVSFMGYSKKTTPNLDQLSEEAAVFTRAFSVGPLTPHSLPSILTSTYPLDYQGPNGIKKPRKMISEVLREQGYITAAFHSNPYLSNFLGYNQGWDYFEDVTPLADLQLAGFVKKKIDVKVKKILWPLSKIRDFLQDIKNLIKMLFPELFFRAKFILYKKGQEKQPIKVKVNGSLITRNVREFINSVKDREFPFFCWVHYMDVHSPYFSYSTYAKNTPLSYPEIVSWGFPDSFSKIMKKFIEKNLPIIIDLYDQGIKYVDEQVGELIKFLKKENLYQNTIIMVTADHGEEFFEHGKRGHPPQLYNELLHVPLLIKVPQQDKKEVINRKVSLIDLAPTICRLAKVEAPPSFKGNNLFEERNRPIFHQTGKSNKRVVLVNRFVNIDQLSQCKVACQDENWKYILDYGSGSEELYNLSEDPEEQNNLSNFNKEMISQMRQKIKEFEKENPPLETCAVSSAI